MRGCRRNGRRVTYPLNREATRDEEGTGNNHRDGALLPVWHVGGRVHYDTPEGIQQESTHGHGVEDDGANGIIASALADGACPAVHSRIDHIGRAAKVEGGHDTGVRHVALEEDDGNDELQGSREYYDGDAFVRGVDKPAGEDLRDDGHALYAKGIAVDCGLVEA